MNIISEYKYGKIIYNTNDYYMGTCISEYKEYCESEITILSKIIKKGDVVLDVGANIGLMTIPFSKMVGNNGRVIAYEPQSEIFKILCGNIAINNLTNVDTINAGVGDSNDLLYLPKIDYTKSNNFGGFSLQTKGEIPVNQIKLDTINNYFNKIDLIKIDVEGMESNVLKGASNLIKTKRPILYVENDRKDKSKDVLFELLSNNYECYWHISKLFSPNNHKNNPINVFDIDYICINILAYPKEKQINLGSLTLKKIRTCDDWFE